MEIGYGVKDPYEVDHSFYSYVKDDKTYERYSNYQSLIYTGAFTESSDLSKLFNHYRGNITMSGVYLKASEVTNDGNVDLADLSKLFNYYRGNIKEI